MKKSVIRNSTIKSRPTSDIAHFKIEQICRGASPSTIPPPDFYASDTTKPFEIAFDNTEKIINCSAFRRMQGKTQVYPFPETDAVRNRLTHSIEVAHIGHDIAAKIFGRLDCDEKLKRAATQIVNNGCLLHDIGNPPFGHGGEEAIREFFRQSQKIPIIRDAFRNKKYKGDFLNFDGNAQGFRIATTLNGRKFSGGLRLGAASLCAMVKYPYSSTDLKGKKGKFGYMSSEESLFLSVFKTCGLMDDSGAIYRSPLSLIVEAADDIAYLTADVHDAFICGDLTFGYARDALMGLAGNPLMNLDELEQRDQIAEWRSLAVKRMIGSAVEELRRSVFNDLRSIRQYERFSLWESEAAASISASEKQLREKSNQNIYRGRRKVALQVAGGRIIKFVLGMQLTALGELYQYFLDNRTTSKNISTEIRSKLEGPATLEELAGHLFDQLETGLENKEAAQIIVRMPEENHHRIRRLFIESCKRKQTNSRGPKRDERLAYELIQLAVDFVSGTTDRYLNNYSKEWAGPSLI